MKTATPNLIEELYRENADRRKGGLRRKWLRMAAGAFPFFRGTNGLFARAWPKLRPQAPGPNVWLCGDLHLENFGAFPTDDGEYRFDVNDFDESIVGPCSLDLVRCSTSILLAAEAWELPPTRATGMVLAYLDTYRKAVAQEAAEQRPVEAEADWSRIGDLVAATRLGSAGLLLKRLTRRKADGTRRIRTGDGKHVAIGAKSKWRSAVTEALEAFGKLTGLTVQDLAWRYAGIGSLGLGRFTVLAEESGKPLLLALKEARPSLLRGAVEGEQPKFADEAERVVTAQRLLQGKPTARLAALTVRDQPYRIRVLIPDENRSSLNQLRQRPGRLRKAVAIAGRLTARSQWRGGKPDGADRTAELAAWATGPALESVLAAAVRFAEWVRRDYAAYRKAYRSGAFDV